MKEKIKEILKRTLNLTDINDDIAMTNCEKWDSLSHLNLVVELESEFGITIEPEDIAEMRSLKSIVNKINQIYGSKSE